MINQNTTLNSLAVLMLGRLVQRFEDRSTSSGRKKICGARKSNGRIHQPGLLMDGLGHTQQASVSLIAHRQIVSQRYHEYGRCIICCFVLHGTKTKKGTRIPPTLYVYDMI